MKVVYFPQTNNSVNFNNRPDEIPPIFTQERQKDYKTYNPPNYKHYNSFMINFKNTNSKKMSLVERQDKFTGCLLGGAIGDAFGAPVEFMKLKKIKKIFGEEGITELLPNKKYGGVCFTDDTQLTLFTAEALLKSAVQNGNTACPPNYNILFDSYRDWYKICYEDRDDIHSGWLSEINGLRGNKCSGKTIMATLSQDKSGSVDEPINNSKGCGGVMRVAPIGLMYYDNPKQAFETAVNATALTHGHPVAYLSAGVYASMISYLVKGDSIEDAVEKALKLLDDYDDGDEIADLINKALELAKDETVEPKDAIKELGKGWNADEAVAMALYAATKTPDDYKQVLINASNHDGDSDTVSAIAGAIIGASAGCKAIPQELRHKIKMESVIIQLAKDLAVSPSVINKGDKKYLNESRQRTKPLDFYERLYEKSDCSIINLYSDKKDESMNKTNYFRYIEKDYAPVLPEEEKCYEALKGFVSEGENSKLSNKGKDFMAEYSALRGKILSDEQEYESAKLSLFCMLVEGLDAATSSEVAAKLTYCLFDDFFESFDITPEIKTATGVYLKSDLLKRASVKERLKYSTEN